MTDQECDQIVSLYWIATGYPEVLEMDKFAQAVQLHQGGRLLEAERLYRELVAEQKEHAQAWFLLSVLLMGRGDDVTALDGLQRAAQVVPDNPAILSNLGLLYRRLGNHDLAASTLLRAVSLKPDLVEASYNLGLVLLDLGQPEAAAECFRQVADLRPNLAANQQQFARILVANQEPRRALGHLAAAMATDPSSSTIRHELAALLVQLGRKQATAAMAQGDDAINDSAERTPEGVPSAMARFHQSVELRKLGQLEASLALLTALVETWPQWFEAVVELGSALLSSGDLEAAQLCFEQAIDLRMNSADAHQLLANTLIMLGESEVAVGHLQCAMLLAPSSTDVLKSLAGLYLTIERRDAAEILYRRIVELHPNDAAAQADLGTVLAEKGESDSALDCYDIACKLDPTLQSAWLGRANIFFDTGRVEAAITAHREGLRLGHNATMHGSLLYHMMFDPCASTQALIEEGQRWHATYAAKVVPNICNFPNSLSPDRRLRIGWLSPDFREHCQSFFTIPLFSHLDRDSFELIAYSTTPRTDQVTDRLKTLVDEWRDVRALDDERLTELIREDAPDILVDLTMHMQNGRPLVFARKPAPIQVCWLAYPGTTGLETMDYRFSDQFLEPLGRAESGGVERCLRLPDSFWCYDPLTISHEVGPLPAARTKRVTFGCLNNFAKTNHDTFALWARVLEALPTSQLLLLAPKGSARERTLREFEVLGVAAERIEFVSRQPRSEYLETYRRIDVCLDTIPYNGHTTSFDAFWMGVPVVTLVGNTAVGRAGQCQAHHLGTPELVSATANEFVERVTTLCSDLERLEEIRTGLRDRLKNSPLMDAPRFARNFASALRGIWRDYCSRASTGT